MLTLRHTPEYRIADGVFLTTRDGIARLLDFGRGQFYGLDPIGTAVLETALAEGTEAAVDRVAGCYSADPDVVRADAKAMLTHLARLRLLVSTSERSSRCWLGPRQLLGRVAHVLLIRPLPRLARWLSAGQPGSVTVRIALLAAWASLRLIGWADTIAWLQRSRKPPRQLPPTGATSEWDHRLRAVAARGLLFPAVCKERAVAAAFLLWVVCGLPGTVVVGLDCYPFQAHAWVEADGCTLTDDVEHCRLFEPVARYS